MQDDINWKLSLLLDDELDPREAIGLLEKIPQDSELLAKWYAYQTIRQALRGSQGIQLKPDFLEQVRSALADEVVVSSEPQPERWTFDFKRFNLGGVGRWSMPLALTALAVLIVLVGKRLVVDPAVPVPQMALVKLMQEGKAKSQPASGYSQLEDYYLLVHSEDSLYLTGPQPMLGYARIVSHGGR
jgi:negative regulator of sigma E activity